MAEREITPEQIVHRRSHLRSLNVLFQFVVVSRILITLHLPSFILFNFNFLLFIFLFIFFIRSSSSSWRSSRSASTSPPRSPSRRNPSFSPGSPPLTRIPVLSRLHPIVRYRAIVVRSRATSRDWKELSFAARVRRTVAELSPNDNKGFSFLTEDESCSLSICSSRV